MNKFHARARRSMKTRAKIRQLGATRLSIFRTPQHIYAQVIDPKGAVLAAASTVEKDFRSEFGGNVSSAEKVGALVAERAISKGVTKVAFDRSGFKFHGRVKALATKAREAGLQF